MYQDSVEVHILVWVVSFLFANETASNCITEAGLSTAILPVLQMYISYVIVTHSHCFVVAFIFISVGCFLDVIVSIHLACFSQADDRECVLLV